MNTQSLNAQPLVLGGEVKAQFTYTKVADTAQALTAARAEQEQMTGYALTVKEIATAQVAPDGEPGAYECFVTFAPHDLPSGIV